MIDTCDLKSFVTPSDSTNFPFAGGYVEPVRGRQDLGEGALGVCGVRSANPGSAVDSVDAGVEVALA